MPYKAEKQQREPYKPRVGTFATRRDDFEAEEGRSSVTPAKLGRLMRAADQGDTRAMFEFFSVVEEDPHVGSVLGKRRRAVTSRTMIIEPMGESAQAKAAAEICSAAIWGDETSEGISNWQDALDTMMDAIGRGFSLGQLIWTYRDARWQIARIEQWEQRNCILGAPWQPMSGVSANRIRILTDAAPVHGEDPDLWQWVAHVSKARAAVLPKAALLRMVAWYFLFKRFSMRDWTIFCERFGMPIPVGKYPASATDDERDAVIKAVFTIGKDGGAVFPEGAMLELIEKHQSGELPYDRLVAVCDSQISKAVLGGTLTTEAGNKGARSLGEVHERNEDDINDSDAEALARTIKRDILTPLVRFNLGTAPIPEVSFLSDEQEDLLKRARRDKIVVKEIGLPVAKAYFYETYGIPEPQGDEDLVEPPRGQKLFTDPDDDDEGDEGEDNKKVPNRVALAEKKKSLAWAV